MAAETSRLAFVSKRDGLTGALKFAEQTMKTYRKAVLTSAKTGHDKPHFASYRSYRRSFIESYLELKRFVLANRGT